MGLLRVLGVIANAYCAGYIQVELKIEMGPFAPLYVTSGAYARVVFMWFWGVAMKGVVGTPIIFI